MFRTSYVYHQEGYIVHAAFWYVFYAEITVIVIVIIVAPCIL